jgi:hypothetical protein
VIFLGICFYFLVSLSLLDIFPKLRILVLHNVHESDASDLEPYLSIISFIEKFVLNNCPLSKISTLLYKHLLNSSIKNQHRLTSCILHSTDKKDGIFIPEPISTLYQSQNSLTYLRIDVRDFASLKYLLMFLPALYTLG